jgi:hypothetical protein
MGFSRDAETIMSPLRLADNTPQDVGELVHDLAGDVLVTGIHGGLGDQSVGTDQAVIESLDGQREDPNLGIGDGNAGNDFVLLSQVKGFRIQASSAPSFARPGRIGFHRRVESGFQDLGQHLHVIDGRIPLGEHALSRLASNRQKKVSRCWRSCSIQ